ncbi:MAG: hypothetical protein ACOC5T_04590 [Elusimicrobiota bacterium]
MKRFMTVIVIIFLSLMWIRFWTGCDARPSYKEREFNLKKSFLEHKKYSDNNSNKEDAKLKNEVDNVKSNFSDKKSVVKRKIIRHEYGLRKVGVKKLYATCYSKYDGPTEMKGIYANQKFADRLHLRERRIQRHHFTVALNPEMDNYHRALIQLPNGTWTHKYRFHVPGYNPDKFPVVREETYPKTQKILSAVNHKYFSVPRDRMKWKGRIDVLFTTAGKYNSIEQRQRYWAKKNTHNTSVEIWEIQKIAIYSDGTRNLVR